MEMWYFLRYVLSFLMIAAGILHFVKPQFYKKIMPSWLPCHTALIIISGIVEIIAGLLLFFAASQKWGAYLTIALLIAVFPANIKMSWQYYMKKKKGFWWTVLRLPLQFVLIWWAYQYLN